MGAVAGWLYLAQLPTGSVVPILIAGSYAASVTGGGRETVFAFGTALVLTAFLLNAAGLRMSALAQMASLVAIAVGITLIVGPALGRVAPSSFEPFAPHGPTAVGVAAVQLFWAFVGWEAITPLAAEFRSAGDIWRASALAVVVVGALYLALAVATVGTHAYGVRLGGDAPLVRMASGVFGRSAALVVGVAGFVVCFAPVNVYTAGMSRLACALARRGQLPAWLGVESASGTPRRALAVLGGLCALAVVVAYIARWDIASVLPLSTSSFLATYVLSMAAAAKLLRPPLRYAAVLSLAACAAVLVFVGTLLAWLAAVAAGALMYYQRFGGARTR